MQKRAFALFLGAFVAMSAAAGCELITQTDRSKIPHGSGGENPGGSGGTGGATASTTGTGGKSTGGTGGTGGDTGGTGGTSSSSTSSMGGSDGGTPCTSPNECPGTDDECQKRTCTSGVCGVKFTDDGTPVTPQTTGDCQKVVCDGAGSTKPQNDDADLPVDQNPCTQDLCNNGVKSNPPLGSGTVCGTNLICDGSGTCVGCVTANDCPGNDTECRTRTCSAGGTCGVDFAAPGKIVTAQVDGDCKQDQCDGNGNVETVVADTDLPVDNNPCTQDVCTNGVKSNPAVASGGACNQNGGSVCDGNGACVGCVAPATCPGTDTECQTRTCVNNTCGFSFTANGTAVTAQIPGDCKRDVCDGAGAIVPSNDDADLPNDSNPCTQDVCTNGVKSNPVVASGTSCGTNLVCDGSGTCVGCAAPTDCPGQDNECQARTCVNNTCGFSFTANGTLVAAQTPNDCQKNVCNGAGAIVSVADNTDAPLDDGNQCTDDVCTAGAVSHPFKAPSSTCSQAGGQFCNATGSCVQCTAASQCAGSDTECQTRTCSPAGVCGFSFAANGVAVTAQTPNDCQKNVCNGSGAIVSVADDTDAPLDDGNQCTDDVCTAGAVSHPLRAANTACSQSGGAFCNATGSCVQCTTASQCSGSDTECQTRTCSPAGACGFNFAANGTALAAQTTGDCKRAVCNGAGATTSTNDDLDLPVDGNPCTGDVCTNGVPSNPPAASGTSCNGSGGVCNGTGACVGCVAPADCPGTDTECQTRTCSSGVCGFNFAANNTPVASQTTGDCQRNVCNGSGAIVSVADNADLPVDNNQCTSDVCTAGVPSNPPVASGATCNQGGTVCNGAGACVGCVAPTDCPGSDTECQTRTCTGGTCGFSFAANGTAVAAQTAGDCKRNVCDGSGAIVSANDDVDLPVDNNQCTSDVCTAGVPSNPPAASGATCNQGGTVCNGAGACVGCTAPAQCPGSDTECQTRTCNSGVCGFSFTANGTPVAAQTAGDCKRSVCNGAGTITSIADNADLPVDGNQCTSDVCTAGAPSNPPVASGSSCSQSGGTVCNGAGACVGCVTPTTCPGSDTECQTRTCNAGVCGFSFVANGTPVAAQTAGDCKRNVCDGAGAIIAAQDDADVPVDGNQCTSDFCMGGVPSNPPAASGTTCNQSGGAVCNGSGACVQCTAPTQCPGSDTECQTRTCNAGVCGFSFTANGTTVAAQTAGDCQRNVCNGSGSVVATADNTDVPVDGNQCTSDVCTAGVPSNPPVASGASCNQNGGTTCNGAGACVGCVAPTDCPGADTECQTRTCTSGVCGFNFTSNGTPVAAQTTGDCQRNICNGAGTIVSVADNADLPVDSNQCTADVCTAGVPSNPPVAPGSACNQAGGAVCNAVGACVQCNAAADCSGTDTECQTRTCSVAGACGFSFTANGTPVAAQTPGDCQASVCNGAGATVSVADNNDLPVDGNQCTNDVCTSGVPSNPPSASGTSCNQAGGTSCNGAGACVSGPGVASTTPADGGMAVASTTVAVTFTQAMNPATLTAQTTAGACSGSIQVSVDDFASCVAFATAAPVMSSGNTIATLTPQPGLLVNRTYKIRVTTAAQNASGTAIAPQYTAATGFGTTNPLGGGTGVVISEVFGGGGGTNPVPTYRADYMVLHNRGTTAVSLTGWSVQYASSTGTGAWTVGALATTANPNPSIAAGGYYLVQVSTGSTGAVLPTPDTTTSNSITMSATAGKVALVNNITALNGTCPTGAAIQDMVGYGTGTTCFETAVTPTLSSTTSAMRNTAGCTDAGNNSTDFAVVTPNPRNSASPPFSCGPAQNESGAALEVDYCATQFPLSLTVAAATSQTVYGRIYNAGNTDQGVNPPAGVTAQFGYGPVTANPEYEFGWRWTAATHNAGCGSCGANDDEFQATFTTPAAGTYRYGYRFSLDSGATWTYCDNNQADGGAGSNPGLTFDLTNLATLTTN